jgi:hypothetical protein
VHHDRRAVVRGRLHRADDLPVVAVEHAGVGHEQLEARDPLVDQLVHRLERVVVHAADDLVEPVVDRAVAVGLGVPGGQAVLDPLAGALDGEVDDRRRPAPRGGRRPGLERVGRERAAERQLHVRVRVDAAGHDVLPGGVDHAVGGRREVGAERRRARREHGGDRLAVHEDVGRHRARRADDGAAADEDPCHGCSSFPAESLGRWAGQGAVVAWYESGRRSR